jgi:RND family efflux transporter MFP subunit
VTRALAALALAACGRPAAPPPSEAPPVVQLDADSVAAATPGEVDGGPLVSGLLRPAVEAALRAEVSGTVIAAPPEPGTQVERGQVLVRFDESAVADAEHAAGSAVAAARRDLALARRDAARYRRLADAGALAPREAETAARAAAAARAALADAEARLSSARSARQRAVVRAPFDGVVSARAVKAGDVVQPGAPLVTVIDPASMRLEAAVPADRAGEIALGQPVEFEVTGYGERRFAGTIARISPVADPATGQVGVVAELPNLDAGLIGGLHAEGRVVTRRGHGLVVPLAAIDRRQLAPAVLRLDGGAVERVPVTLGLVDPVGERVIVAAGLSPGDLLLVGGARELAPGTRVEVAPPPRAAAGG